MELELELELKITELELELNWKNGIDPNPGCVYSADPFILCWLWEYTYFILSLSSNRKYDPYAIIKG